MHTATDLEVLFRQLRLERDRQELLYGLQRHPSGTGPGVEVWAGTRAGEASAATRAACTDAFADGEGTWRHILLEEVFEAVCEGDPAALPGHLVQVAAVALAWLEAHPGAGGTPPAQVGAA